MPGNVLIILMRFPLHDAAEATGQEQGDIGDGESVCCNPIFAFEMLIQPLGELFHARFGLCGGLFIEEASVVITNNVIRESTITGGAKGGGLYIFPETERSAAHADAGPRNRGAFARDLPRR